MRQKPWWYCCPKYRESWIDGAPLAKVLTPEDVAEAVDWLAAAPSDLTGELINLDGGKRLGKA